MENNTENSQKIKNRTTIQSSNFTSEYLSEENKKTLIQKDTCILMFTVELFIIQR